MTQLRKTKNLRKEDLCNMIMRTNLYVEDGRVKSQLEHSSKRTLPINLMKLEPTNPEDSCFVFYEQENPDQIICKVAYTEKREKPELFYETEKMFRGKGYMTQAMKQVLDWMIQNECTGTLWLFINIQNIPSQKIAKHYGFVLSGEQVNSDQQWYCLNLAEIKENNHG